MHWYVNISKLLAPFFFSLPFSYGKPLAFRPPVQYHQQGPDSLMVILSPSKPPSTGTCALHGQVLLTTGPDQPLSGPFPSLTSSTQIFLVGLQQHSPPEWIPHWGSSLLQVMHTHVKDWEIFRASITNIKLNECINPPNTSLNKKVDSRDGRDMKNTAKILHNLS